MNRLTQIRLTFFAIGISVWGYGYASDDTNVRWIGIGFLAVAVLLRFYPRTKGDDSNTAL